MRGRATMHSIAAMQQHRVFSVHGSAAFEVGVADSKKAQQTFDECMKAGWIVARVDKVSDDASLVTLAAPTVPIPPAGIHRG